MQDLTASDFLVSGFTRTAPKPDAALQHALRLNHERAAGSSATVAAVELAEYDVDKLQYDYCNASAPETRRRLARELVIKAHFLMLLLTRVAPAVFGLLCSERFRLTDVLPFV